MIALRYLAAATLVLTLPAVAQAEPEVVGVRDWAVGPAGDTACQAVNPVSEHLAFGFTEDTTGEGTFMLGDDRWKLDGVALAPGSISWDGGKTMQKIDFQPTQTPEGLWLLLADTGPWFSENLAESSRVLVQIPSIEFEQDFKFPQTIDVIAAIADCNQQH